MEIKVFENAIKIKAKNGTERTIISLVVNWF